MRVSPATAIGCFSLEADASASPVHNWREPRRAVMVANPSALCTQPHPAVLAVGTVRARPFKFSLALSLVKRIPDLLLGVPGLLVWHAFETRRLFFSRNPAP